MNPIFETSFLGSRARVYSDRVEYRPFYLVGDQIIPIKQISSVVMAMAGVQQVTIETTGGKAYQLIIRLSQKEPFRDAILKVMN